MNHQTTPTLFQGEYCSFQYLWSFIIMLRLCNTKCNSFILHTFSFHCFSIKVQEIFHCTKCNCLRLNQFIQLLESADNYHPKKITITINHILLHCDLQHLFSLILQVIHRLRKFNFCTRKKQLPFTCECEQFRWEKEKQRCQYCFHQNSKTNQLFILYKFYVHFRSIFVPSAFLSIIFFFSFSVSES